jgi:spore coat protein H
MLRDRFRLIFTLVALLAAPATVSWAQTAPVPVVEPDPSDPFFDDTVVHDIRLTINVRDWESLKVNYLDNTVYPCYFQWTNQTIRNVGIRSRGTGSRSGVKPGLRVDFDYYSTDQKFLGLKSVILRNNTQDASNMRERVSMLFFRRMEVKAVREAHARLFINSDYAGVYTIVESIDKNFLKKNFGENNGHLYEYKFNISAPEPFDFGYLGSDADLYAPLPFKPQTLENDPQGQVFERLFWTANQAGDAVWRTAMEEFLDLKKFLKHVAIENFLADQDGIAGDYGPNNFYLYRFENRNLFIFLPWDKSQAFWESPSPNYFIFRNIEDGTMTHRNRLVARALSDTELREFYLDTLLACADAAAAPSDGTISAPGSDALGWLEAEIVREYDQIKLAVTSDTTKLNSNEEFEKASADIKTFARLRSNNVREQVAADRARRGVR